uniref:Uncharacterized protein n=1 Tax=Cacopsylla melanoneura TaxID=428564 RepID=A0A8D8QBX0_9HEMI
MIFVYRVVPKIEMSLLPHSFGVDISLLERFSKIQEWNYQFFSVLLTSSCSSSISNSTAATSFVIGDERGQPSPTTSTAKGLSRKEKDGFIFLKSVNLSLISSARPVNLHK